MEDPRVSTLQYLVDYSPLPGLRCVCCGEPITDSCIAFVACRLAQQRGDSDDGSPSGTNAETPSSDDFR